MEELARKAAVIQQTRGLVEAVAEAVPELASSMPTLLQTQTIPPIWRHKEVNSLGITN